MIDLTTARRLTREESEKAGVKYSAKRYTDASGRIYTYRQYRDARARARGFASERRRAQYAVEIERVARRLETPGLSSRERKEFLRLLKNTPPAPFVRKSPREFDLRLTELANKVKVADPARYYDFIKLTYR